MGIRSGIFSPQPSEQSTPPSLSLAQAALVALLVMVPTAVDLLLQRYNFSVVYFIPLIFYAQLRRSRGLWTLAILLVLITYGCYVADRFDELWAHPTAFWSYRLVNRTYTAIGILIATYLIGSWVRFQDYWSRKTGPLDDAEGLEKSFIRVEFLMDRAIATLVALLLIAAIAWSDFHSPGQINQANLYMVPLVLMGLTMNRNLLWSMVPVLLLLTYLGYVIGPSPSVNPRFVPVAVSSRLLTAFSLLTTAWLIHVWIVSLQRGKPQPPHPDPPRDDPEP